MALETSRAALEWVSLDGKADNLVSVLALRFDIFNAYEIDARATYMARGLVGATGFVVDNLDNPSFVVVTVMGVQERIAPFSKSAVRLFGNALSLNIASETGPVNVAFFTGLFPGALQGANMLGAFKSANT